MAQHSSSAKTWRKSSRCETNTCLEISRANDLFWLRNSARPGVAVSCTTVEWDSFREALIRGEFDDLAAGTP